MKVIIVEGQRDALILDCLFSELLYKNKVKVHVAMGFSNVISVARALIDYGEDVLMIMDTDSNIPNHDKRHIIDHIGRISMTGRPFEIVWMDPFIERVIERVVPEISEIRKTNSRNIVNLIIDKRNSILSLEEFEKIRNYIG